MYIYSDVDATMLRLFEALFEAAPQLILQLYIVFGHHHCDGEWQWYRTNECSNSSNSTQLDMNSTFPLEDVSPTWPLRWLNLRLNTFQGGLQVISMITSWVSLGFAMVSFQRALRASQQPTKQRLSVCAWVMQFFWYFSFIGSRIFVIVLLFLISGVIGAAFCFLHCALMFMWLTQQRTTFCAEVFHVREIGYRICVSIVYLFCFFNVVDHPTFLKYVLYYILAFVENGAVLGIWYVLKDYEPEVLYRDYAVVLVTVLSVIGPLLFQLPYYFWCHPEIGNWERVKRGKEPISLRDRLLRFSTGFPVRRSAAAFHATDDAVNFRMCSSNEKCSAKSTAKLMPV